MPLLEFTRRKIHIFTNTLSTSIRDRPENSLNMSWITSFFLFFLVDLGNLRSRFVSAACCCEYPDTEVWEAVWCGTDPGKAYLWGDIPTDESLGHCSDWVEAGDLGDHSTVTIQHLNAEYVANVSNCEAIFGNASNDCAVATSVLSSKPGSPQNVVCTTVEDTPTALSGERIPTLAAGPALLLTIVIAIPAF